MSMKEDAAFESQLTSMSMQHEHDEGTDAPMTAQEDPETVEKTIDFETVKKAIQKKDGKATLEALRGATDNAINQVANDSSLMATIKKFDEKYRNLSYDYLYSAVQDVNTLLEMVDSRFGVLLVGPNQQMDKMSQEAMQTWKKTQKYKQFNWTRNAVSAMYRTYLSMPQAYLDQIVAVYSGGEDNGAEGVTHNYSITEENEKGEQKTTYHSRGIYGLFYNDETTDINEGEIEDNGHYCHITDTSTWGQKDSEGNSLEDGAVGMYRFDHASAHELGHVVDYNSNPLHSNTDKFRECSLWKEHASDSKELVKYMEDECFETGKAFPEAFKDPEKEIARSVAKSIIDNKIIQNNDQINTLIDTEMKNAGGKLSGRPATLQEEEKNFKAQADEVTKHNELSRYTGDEKMDYDYSMLTKDHDLSLEAIKLLIHDHTDLVNQARRGQYDGDNGAWYQGELFKNMKRQIHQNDKNTWFSYDSGRAQEKKISLYQLQDPHEEFAEAFAVYYMSKDDAERASRMPAKLKQWFDDNMDKSRSRDKYNA